MTTEELLDLLSTCSLLADRDGRSEGASLVARALGARELVMFVRDPAVARSLPGAGFPQTLRGAAAWRALVDRAIEHQNAEGPLQSAGGEQNARAIGAPDGTAAVLIGGRVDESRLEMFRMLLPLLGALLRSEAVAHHAGVEAVMARQSAAQAADLASKLDTTRAELQEALSIAERATRARDEFLATVSHELRTPLTSIIGWIQLLRLDRHVSSIADGLETIERNAWAQQRLIEDILDFSRINAGKLRLDVRQVDLAAVINAAIDVVRPAANAKGIRIDALLDQNAGAVSGDSDRLQQVVWNLMSNAVKFTPRNGRVQVRLERINSHSEIRVSDTGEGIAPDFLPSVFDRFSQADSSSSRMHAGLGLGLGIVRHLVELHGGTVQAFSDGVGKGATFVVRLPLLLAHHREVNEARESRELSHVHAERQLSNLSGLSVLVLEDNEDSKKLLTTILIRAGAKVEAATGVNDALRLVAGGGFDVVVSDIEMPGEDGYSFIRRMRVEESDTTRVPAIALTAYARTADRVRALAAGFQMHITKPVEPAELVAAVRSLATRRAQS